MEYLVPGGLGRMWNEKSKAVPESSNIKQNQRKQMKRSKITLGSRMLPLLKKKVV
jgi:hypothetical protein